MHARGTVAVGPRSDRECSQRWPGSTGFLRVRDRVEWAAVADRGNLEEYPRRFEQAGIEKWKASGSDKKQALGNVDSIQRNLQGALPEIITQLRNAPEDLSATFKLYRNLDALYDVLNNVAELAGAFGSRDDLQSLSNAISGFEGSRKQLAERIENLSSSKEQELTRLRAQLKTLQAQVEAAPPKKVVVDDTEPPKKPATKKKSSAPKKPADPTKPSSGTGTNPPAQQQGQTKPQ